MFLHVLFAVLLADATPSPSPSPSPAPTAEPLDVRARAENNENAPIHMYRVALSNAISFRYYQCVSFRNVSTKVATDVDFSFVVTNRHGESEAEWKQLDKGTFTPPTDIDNHCWYGRLWPARVVKRMTDESVRIERVTFADGSFWVPGGDFMRAYSNDGNPLPAPVAVGSGGAAQNVPPAQSTGPLSLQPGFGAIFYEPGTFASGSAVDRPNADAARADARSACNAQSAGRNDCVAGIEFSTQRCGTIGVLGDQVEYGVGDNERDARAMVLGKIPGARIITAACNSPRS
jgi:hypothetical protein